MSFVEMPFLIVIFYFFALFTSQSFASEGKKFLIVVTLKPICLLVNSIVGDFAQIEMVGNVDFHHNLALKPSEITKIEKADLILHQGFMMSKRFMNNKNAIDLSKVVHLIPDRKLKIKTYAKNSNLYDQHFWLSPDNAISIAKVVAKKMIEIDNQNADFYQQNFNLLKKSITISAQNALANLSYFKNKQYVVVHDAYQYFEKYFDIRMPVGCFYDAEHNIANAKIIQLILNSIQRGSVNCIIVDTLAGKRALKNKMPNNVNFVIIDPLGNDGYHSSYSGFFEDVVKKFISCFD